MNFKQQFILNRFHCLILFCLILFTKGFCQNVHQSVPYDLIFIAYDTKIDVHSNDALVFTNIHDIESGFEFGITNSPYSGTGQEFDLETAFNLKYTASSSIPKGTTITIKTQNGLGGGIIIELDNVNKTSSFDIDQLGSLGDFVPRIGPAFLYSGSMVDIGTSYSLLGTVLDGVYIGQNPGIELPRSIQDKNPQVFSLGKGGSENDSEGFIDTEDCDLCELLDLLLDAAPWNIDNDNTGNQMTIIEGWIEDCIDETCNGALTIKNEECYYYPLIIPCANVTYFEWQIISNGSPITIFSGNGQVTPYLFNAQGTYQLFIICDNGCEYTSNSISCTPPDPNPECEATLVPNGSGCNFSATLTNCTSYSAQWYKEVNMSYILIPGATGLNYTGNENTNYKLVVTGCDNCPDLSLIFDGTSNNCGPVCDCTSGISIDPQCNMITSDPCPGYSILWEYSNDNGVNYTNINTTSNSLDVTINGNGFYRRTLAKAGCPNIVDIENVSCLSNCAPSVNANLFSSNGCILDLSFEECGNPVINWFFYPSLSPNIVCENINNYTLANGTQSALIFNPNNGGYSTTFDPTDGQGCYMAEITCGDCGPYYAYTYKNLCCPSNTNFELSENNCVLTASNIHCSGSFDYVLTLNGNFVSSGNNVNSFPPYTSSEDGLYELEITCSDGCMYTSSENVNCACNSSVMISNPNNDCNLVANVVSCSNASFQWQIKHNINDPFVDIPGATNATYTSIDDAIYRVVMSGCANCTDLFSNELSVNCYSVCNCQPTVTINSSDCNRIDVDQSNCSIQYNMEWFYQVGTYSNGAPDWESMRTYGSSFYAHRNGNFMVRFSANGCPTFESNVININCLTTCNLAIYNPILDPVTCYVSFSYEGCATQDPGYPRLVHYTSMAQNICSQTPSGSFNETDAIFHGCTSFNGITTCVYEPLVEGCYWFEVQCNDNGDCVRDGVDYYWNPCCEANITATQTTTSVEYVPYFEDLDFSQNDFVSLSSIQNGTIATVAFDYDEVIYREVGSQKTEHLRVQEYVSAYTFSLEYRATIDLGGYVNSFRVYGINNSSITSYDIDCSSVINDGVVDFETALNNEINSILNTQGFIQQSHRILEVELTNNSELSIRFHCKPDPTLKWLGIEASDSEISFVPHNGAQLQSLTGLNNAYFLSNSLDRVISFGKFTCGGQPNIDGYVTIDQNTINLNTSDYRELNLYNSTGPVNVTNRTTATCQESVTQLTANANCSNPQYIWSTGETTQSIFVFDPSIGYDVSVICGNCTATDSYNGTTTRQTTGQTKITSNTDVSSELLNTNTGHVSINRALEKTQLNIYPNPSIDLFNIEFYSSKAEEGTITVTSTTGEIIETLSLSLEKGVRVEKLRTTNLPPGIYLLSLKTDSTYYPSKKIIVLK